MTTDEYLCQSLKCSISELEDCLDFQNENGYLLDEIRLVMKNYAILMCQRQRQICSEKAKMNTADFPKAGINLDSILNSPLPEELQ